MDKPTFKQIKTYPLAVRRPSTLSAYEPSLRERAGIIGEDLFKKVTGREPGYDARDFINRATGLIDLADLPGIALSADDAARNLKSKQYGAAAGDIAALAVGAIPIAGGVLKGGAKTAATKGVEAATRLAARYGTELPNVKVSNLGGDWLATKQRFANETAKTEDLAAKYDLPPAITGAEREANLASFMEGSRAPRVLYHGTIVHPDQVHGNITSFNPKQSQKTLKRPNTMNSIGSWFSETPGDFDSNKPGAGLYSGTTDQGSAIYPVHASIKNPWTPSSFDDYLNEMHIAAGRDPKRQNPKGVGSTDELRKELIDAGFDGIHFPYGLDRKNQSPTWVALKPDRQVKSAVGNRGSFDPDEDDITKARGGLVRKYNV